MCMTMRNKQNLHNQVEMKSIFEIKLSKEEYGGIFDKKPTFYEKRAFAAIFRRKWREDQGYCSLFDKRLGYKRVLQEKKRKEESMSTLKQKEANKVRPYHRRIKTAVNSKRRKISQKIRTSIRNSVGGLNFSSQDNNYRENLNNNENMKVENLAIEQSPTVNNQIKSSASKHSKRLNIKRANKSQRCSRSKHKANHYKTHSKINVDTTGFQSSVNIFNRTKNKDSQDEPKADEKNAKQQNSVSSIGNAVSGDSQNLSGLYFRNSKMIPKHIKESSFVRRQKLAMKLASQNKTLNVYKDNGCWNMNL